MTRAEYKSCGRHWSVMESGVQYSHEAQMWEKALRLQTLVMLIRRLEFPKESRRRWLTILAETKFNCPLP